MGSPVVNLTKNFLVEQILYSGIKHPDWFMQVKGQVLTNQNALFRSKVVTTHKFCYEIVSWSSGYWRILVPERL